jgi:hypothetical protein
MRPNYGYGSMIISQKHSPAGTIEYGTQGEDINQVVQQEPHIQLINSILFKLPGEC